VGMGGEVKEERGEAVRGDGRGHRRRAGFAGSENDCWIRRGWCFPAIPRCAAVSFSFGGVEHGVWLPTLRPWSVADGERMYARLSAPELRLPVVSFSFLRAGCRDHRSVGPVGSRTVACDDYG